MKFMIATAVALYALALHAAAAPSEHATPLAAAAPTKTASEVLKLAQWTRAGYCNRNSCQKLDAKKDNAGWTIGGLWGFDKNGTNEATNCTNAKFDPKDISDDLKKDLNTYWPSFGSSNNQSAWADMFNKHGKCALNQTKDLNTTADYFTKAIFLYKQVNIGQLLNGAKIFPSDNTTTTLTAIKAAIRPAHNFDIEVICGNKRNGSRVLEEIRFCFDQKTSAPIACKGADKNCDTKTIYYLKNSSSFATSSVFLVLVTALIAVFFSKN